MTETKDKYPPLSEEEVIDRAIRKNHRGLWLGLHYHRTFKNKRFDLADYPYLRAPLFDDAQIIYCMKSTQGGWTEMLIAKELGEMEKGRFVFWALPTGVIKNRFVKNRFTKTISLTAYYAKQLRGEEEKRSTFDRAQSMSLIHYGTGGVAFVGSNSMSGFGEFPADVGVVDEFDYCDQANIPMVEERLSNSDYRRRIFAGQPTISGMGISLLFKNSNQMRWYMRAACGHVIRPDWFTHVVRKIDEVRYEVIDPEWEGLDGPDARLICHKCGKPVDRRSHGWWHPENPRSIAHGYHFSKLFTTRMSINEILTRFDAGTTNPTIMQRFENADLGEAHSARGSKVQVEDLEACLGDYGQGRCTGSVVVGVDVGAVLHVVIGELMSCGGVRVVWIGTMKGDPALKDLRMLVSGYKLVMGVIDEKPETRLSRRLAYGSRRWWMCRYTQGKRDVPDPKARVISVDRTVQLDAVNEAVMIGKERITLPADALNVEGFVDQMTTLTRVYDEELNRGEGGYVWKGDEADHYMHATSYMLLAKRIVTRR